MGKLKVSLDSTRLYHRNLYWKIPYSIVYIYMYKYIYLYIYVYYIYIYINICNIYIYKYETSILTSARHIAVFDMCWWNSTYGIIFLRLVANAVFSHTQHVTASTTIMIYAFSPITPLRFIPRAVF